MALALDTVTFAYAGDRPVVREVTASLTAGRVTAVLGPNAAGKTTLLRLMLGQLQPGHGVVTLDGESVTAMSARRRARRIGYVPQRGSVGFAFTVRRVVAMGRYAHGEPAEGGAAVEAALASLGLEGLADRSFVELSGGQQQRVLLARAVAQAAGEGRVLLLDEPAAGLDLRHVHEALGLVRRLAGTGLAVAVVMHDLSLAARYADEAWLIDDGRLVAAGPWAEVLDPSRLEPVYGVSLRRLADEGGTDERGEARPVFVAGPRGDTLSRNAPPASPPA